MFESYNEKARRAIFFARQEAGQLGSSTIDAEHLLLGLLREDKQLIRKLVPSLSTVESIRKEIESLFPSKDRISASVSLALSTSAKLVLSNAAEERDRLGHRHIGTEHLLLGILRDEKSPACEILYERGLRISPVREGIVTASASDSEVSKTADLETKFDRLLDLLVNKGVIDDSERRQITG